MVLIPSFPACLSYLQLRCFGQFVRLKRTADRPSLAWPPVADVVSATLRALFSTLPGHSRCSFRQDQAVCLPLYQWQELNRG